MKHKKSSIIIFLLVFLALSFCWWQAKVSALGTGADPAEKYYPSKLRFSTLFSSENRQIFYFDYLFPLFYARDENTLLYINPKEKLFSPWSEETNLGIGLRRIVNDSFILGVYFFYDKTYSRNKNWYSQVGEGFEFLSEPFDFRFNYYDPITKAKTVSDGYSFGETHLLLTTNKEEPLHGFDFEIGAPLYPKALKTRVYLGGFFFDSKLGKDRNGFRARTETNLNSWLSIDTIFNNHNGGETEFIGGFRITIPLQFGKFWHTGKGPLKAAPRESAIKERIFERVVRDIDIQSASTSQTQQDDNVEIIYVDNTNAGAADGTLSHPWPELVDVDTDPRYLGFGGTAKYVYVGMGDGTATGYTGNFTLPDEVILWGSGYNGGFRGLPAPGKPIIDGNAGGDVITLGNNNTVMGLTIRNGTNGISANGKSGGTIKQNAISGNSQDGIRIDSNGGTISDFTVTGNTITGNSSNGIYVYNYYGTISGLTFSNNTIRENTGDGIRFKESSGFEPATITSSTISDNDISDNGADGIKFTNDGEISNFTISGNTISGNGQNGIEFYNNNYYGNSNATISDFSISGNTISSNVGNGVLLTDSYFYYYSYGNGITNIDFGGGALSSAGRNSIFNNVGYDMRNGSGESIFAQHNFWGGGAPTNNLDGEGIDATDPLATNPNL